MGTPQATIYLCSNVRLDNRYIHSIYFPSTTAQKEYFMSKAVKTLAAYSYIRKNWALKVEATMEQARQWNYLFFNNTSGSKTYYYFINNIEYVNDNTVELQLEIDVIQTYLRDMQLLPCFVEREHTTTDNMFEHTLDEGLDVGEYVILTNNNIDLSELCILVQATFDPMTTNETTTNTVLQHTINGIYSGLGIYAVEKSAFQAWGAKLDLLNQYGKIDGIVNMWMYPKNLVTLVDGDSWGDGHVCKTVKSIQKLDKMLQRHDTLKDEYIPKNKKLYCYPYNFLYVTNNAGSAALYHYENFQGQGDQMFTISGAISPDAACICYPNFYKGITDNYEEGITLSGFPTCAWNSDTYKIWLAQNQSQHNLAATTATIQIAAGVGGLLISGGALAAAGSGALVANGLSTINNLLAQKKDASVQPPTAKGNTSTSVQIVNNKATFNFQQKCCKSETLKIIDDFFTKYGYKVNRVKKPTLNNRAHFTYIKTVESKIAGNFCNDDIVKIESIFDNGITFWKDGDSIGDYSLDNSI